MCTGWRGAPVAALTTRPRPRRPDPGGPHRPAREKLDQPLPVGVAIVVGPLRRTPRTRTNAAHRGPRGGALITRVTKASGHDVPVVIAELDAKQRARLSGAMAASDSVEVVGQAADVATAVALASEAEGGVIVIGSGVPQAEALAVLEGLRREAPGARGIMLREDPDDEGNLELLIAGAAGVLGAGDPPESVAAAIAAVARGEAVVGERLRLALLRRFQRATASRRGMRPLLGPLSSREWQVLDLLRGGLSTEEAAERLGIAKTTVYSHLRNIARKLGTRTRDEAIAFAEELRLRGSRPPSRNGDAR